MKKFKFLMITLVVLGLVLVACSDAEEEPTEEAAAPTEVVEAPAEEPTEEMAEEPGETEGAAPAAEGGW